jgi:hypothetical protein
VVKSVEKKKTVAGQFAVKDQTETFCCKKLSKEDYGLDKYRPRTPHNYLHTKRPCCAHLAATAANLKLLVYEALISY